MPLISCSISPGEVFSLITQQAKWYQVNDIIEALDPKVDEAFDRPPAYRFEQRLNDFFLENGIGWQLCDGQVILADYLGQARAPRHKDIRHLARQAEAVGFDSVWLYDHLLHRVVGHPTIGTFVFRPPQTAIN